jgi:hypothetical protein
MLLRTCPNRAEKATVEYDPSVWNPAKLASEIEVGIPSHTSTHNSNIPLQDMGFEATPLASELPAGEDTITLSLYGMTCAS